MIDEKHTDLQKKQELAKHEVQEVMGFLKRYGKLIGAGILAAVVMVFVSRGWAQHKATKLAKAEQALMSAQTSQALETVVKDYSSTPTAPVALLNLAKTLYNEGNYAQARIQYERFLKKYKSHEMSPAAELGLAYCTEADGDFNGAATQFAAFAKKHSKNYLQPVALLSVARCMEQGGRIAEARIILEDFLAENAGSPWAGTADGTLKALNDAAQKK
jgi:TolA-binding protein